MKHTPTPWHYIPGMVAGTGKKQVASTGCEQGIFANTDVEDCMDGKNAEFIVLACNSHDALKAFIEKAIPLMDNDSGWRESGFNLVEEGKSLLEKIKGEKQ